MFDFLKIQGCLTYQIHSKHNAKGNTNIRSLRVNVLSNNSYRLITNIDLQSNSILTIR